jgi:nitrogen regulatory protein P-II 1
MLKKVECYLQPTKLEEIKEALAKGGVQGMTVYECRGFGRHRGYTEDETPAEETKFLPKVKIEIVADEAEVDDIITIIKRLARTGRIGDGKIFVLPVEDALRIRTDEVGIRAIR